MTRRMAIPWYETTPGSSSVPSDDDPFSAMMALKMALLKADAPSDGAEEQRRLAEAAAEAARRRAEEEAAAEDALQEAERRRLKNEEKEERERAVDEHEHQDEAHERKHEHVQNLFASEYVWAPVAPTSLTGYDVRTYFGFYTLFAGNRDIRLPLNLPELVLYAEKMPVSWLFTAKGGEYAGKVLKKRCEQLVPDKIKTSWMAKATGDQNNFEGLVAMLHDGTSLPTLLPVKAFESLAAAMQQERNLGSRLLQFHVLPQHNIVYRATFSKKGEAIIQDVVLVRHSHVYRTLSTTANVIYPTRKMRAVGERSLISPEEIMPAAPDAIKRECIRYVQILMRFMAKAWQLDLDEVVCEFAQDHDHKFWFVRVVSFEWRDGQFAEEPRPTPPEHTETK